MTPQPSRIWMGISIGAVVLVLVMAAQGVRAFAMGRL